MAARISDADLLRAVRTLADELGRPPTAMEMERRGEHSNSVYYERFGLWRETCAAAGVGRPPSDGPTGEELLEDLRRLDDELGRPPTTQEVADGEYCYTTYYRRFGGLPKALEAAGLTPVANDAWHRRAEELREAVRNNPDVGLEIDDTAPRPGGVWDADA